MMRRLAAALLAVLMLLALPAAGFAWGSKGHYLANGQAISLLPPRLRAFFEENRAEIIELAMVPDQRKGDDPREGPRHYLDLDLAANPADYPRTYEDAVRRFGGRKAYRNGVLPWQIETMMADLTAAMKAGKKARVVDLAGRLGHYVADSFPPLHSCENYDGQLTDNQGIHVIWEGSMIERFPYEELMKAHMKPAQVIENPVEFVFSTLLAGHGEVKAILDADTSLKPLRGTPEYFVKFKELVGEMAARRLGGAASAIASFWYTAWVSAGKPNLSEPEPDARGRRE